MYIASLSSPKTMVERICGKILAYSNFRIQSIKRTLSQMIMISEMSGPKLYTGSICTAQQRLHKKSINISCKKFDHLGFHQWREIQVPQYSRTLALWVSCENLLEFGKTQFGGNLFYPTDRFLILNSLRTNWLWNQESTLDQKFNLQKIAQTEGNLTNAVGPYRLTFFMIIVKRAQIRHWGT